MLCLLALAHLSLLFCRYYGYGYSNVFAADVYEHMRNSPGGLLSVATGTKLRDGILAPNAERPAMELLEGFLGRQPNIDAFCRRLGLKA
jgi:Zn-dependent oligopeptidase